MYHLTALKTIEGQAEAFLVGCKVGGLSPSTLKYYRYRLDCLDLFLRGLGITDPAKVTPTEIRLFILHLQESNNPVSVLNYVKAVKRYFNWMVEERTIPSAPFHGIKPMKVPRYIVRPLSKKDLDNLLILTEGEKFMQVRNRAIILVLLDTALRLSEISAIKLTDIDLDRETIVVMGKGGQERVVRIGKSTQKALLRYLLQRHDNCPALWLTQQRKPLTADGLQVAIKVLCDRAEVTDAKRGPHAFRHTSATACLRNGMPETYVQNMLGHSDMRMTRRYTQTINSDDMIRAHIKASPVDNLMKR